MQKQYPYNRRNRSDPGYQDNRSNQNTYDYNKRTGNPNQFFKDTTDSQYNNPNNSGKNNKRKYSGENSSDYSSPKRRRDDSWSQQSSQRTYHKKEKMDFKSIDEYDKILENLLNSDKKSEDVVEEAGKLLNFFQEQNIWANSLLLGLMKIFKKHDAIINAIQTIEIAKQRRRNYNENITGIFALYLGILRKTEQYHLVFTEYNSFDWSPPKKPSDDSYAFKYQQQLEIYQNSKGKAAQEYMVTCKKAYDLINAADHCNKVFEDKDIPDDKKFWMNSYYNKLCQDPYDPSLVTLENAIDPDFYKIKKYDKALDNLLNSYESSEKIVTEAKKSLASFKEYHIMAASLLQGLMKIFKKYRSFDDAMKVMEIAKQRKQDLNEDNVVVFAFYLEVARECKKYDLVFEEYGLYEWNRPKEPAKDSAKFAKYQEMLEIYKVEKGRAALEYMLACKEYGSLPEKAHFHFDKISLDEDIVDDKKFWITTHYFSLCTLTKLNKAIEIAINQNCIDYKGLNVYLRAWKKNSPDQIPEHVNKIFWDGIYSYGKRNGQVLNTMMLWVMDAAPEQIIKVWRANSIYKRTISWHIIDSALITLIEQNTEQSFTDAAEILDKTPFNSDQTDLLYTLMQAAMIRNDLVLAEAIYLKVRNTKELKFSNFKITIDNMFFAVLIKDEKDLLAREIEIKQKYPPQKFFDNIMKKNALGFASYMLYLLRQNRFLEVSNVFTKAENCVYADIHTFYLLSLFCIKDKTQLTKVFINIRDKTEYLNADHVGIYLISLSERDDHDEIQTVLGAAYNNNALSEQHIRIATDFCGKYNAHMSEQTFPALSTMLNIPETQIEPERFNEFIKGIVPFTKDTVKKELNNSILKLKENIKKESTHHDDKILQENESDSKTQDSQEKLTASSNYYGSHYPNSSNSSSSYQYVQQTEESVNNTNLGYS